MTVKDWIRENYAEHGREYVVSGMEECRKVTAHNSSASTWDRQVRRVIRDMEGSHPEPEESFEVKTVEDALSYHDIPEHMLELSKVRVNTWGSETNRNQQVRLDLKPKDETLSPQMWAKAFKTALKEITPLRNKAHPDRNKDLMQVMSIPDIHFGKMISASTIGGANAKDYNPDIAAITLSDAVLSLSNSIIPQDTAEIVYPQGEDTFNVDNLARTTTAGTPQNNSDVYDMIRIGIRTLFETIEYLSEYSNVRIPIVSGNHDHLLSHMVGLILEERYRHDNRITVECSPVQEKVIHYGNSAIFFQHGTRIKPKDLAWRLATKYPHIWGATIHRYAFSGHFHQSHFSDEQGVIVSYLPALVPTGSWEDAMNYFSARQAQLHTFDKERGRILTAYYTPE
jgi:hypothetical protein